MDYCIKELPELQRPREKLSQKGVESMSDVELLSLILRSGTRGKNVKELSAEILDSYSLGSIADRSMEELKKFEGVSDVKAGQLKALSQLARQMQKKEREKIESFSDVKARVEDMKFLEEEKVRALILSSGNELLQETEFEGEVSSVNFSPRKLFQESLKKKGSALILAHNHPSGKSNPTEADVQTTKEMVELGEKLGVKLLDHVIVGEKVKSMRSSSKVKFDSSKTT